MEYDRPGMRATDRLRSPIVVLAPFLFIACSEERINLSLPELPEDIAWATLVLEDPGGALVETTGLLPVRSGRIQFEVPGDRGSSVVLYAYRDRDLDPRIPRDPATLAEPLQVATVEQPVLPTPSLRVRAPLEGGASFVPDEASRDLTAAWLPSCDIVEAAVPSASVLASCGTQNCRPNVAQAGCRVRFDLRGGCGLGLLDLKLLPNDRVESREAPALLGECTGVALRPGGALSVNCRREGIEDCRIDLYPEAASVALEVLETKLVSSASEVQDGNHLLGGLALLDSSELVVSVADDAACTPGGDHRLLFLRRSTLEVTRTVRTPYCIQLMRKDTTGAGFVGLTRAPVALVRYDRDGMLLERNLIEGLPETPDPVPHHWSISPDGLRAAVWVTTRKRSVRLASAFLEVDWASLRVVGFTTLVSSDNFPVGLLSNRFVLLDDDSNTLRFFDHVGGTELETMALATDVAMRRSLWSMMRLGDSDRLVVFVQSALETITLVDEDRHLSHLVDSQLSQPARVGAVLPGPEARLLIVAGDSATAGELVVFDPESRYFLPGVTPLSIQDIPGDAVSDELDPYVFIHYRDTTKVLRVRAL